LTIILVRLSLGTFRTEVNVVAKLIGEWYRDSLHTDHKMIKNSDFVEV